MTTTHTELVPKQMRVVLEDGDWRMLRIAAAELDTSMQGLVASLVRRWLVDRALGKPTPSLDAQPRDVVAREVPAPSTERSPKPEPKSKASREETPLPKIARRHWA